MSVKPPQVNPAIWSRHKLTRSDQYLADRLEEQGRPLITGRDMFQLIRDMYAETSEKKLYLRGGDATYENCSRRLNKFLSANILRHDKDYRTRYRVPSVPDRPADDIVCLVDRFCYISHLSAMQLWSLTDRQPVPLIVTRPDRRTVATQMSAIMEDAGDVPFPLENVGHPDTVRGRAVRVVESRQAGESVGSRGGFARIATVGQTFLDMLQKPRLCGGMGHVLDVWDEHAGFFFEEIVEAVERGASMIAKCRAGYILEKRLGYRDERITTWQACARRGGSRKLDPDRAFAPQYSETWMISLNVS